MKMYFAMCVNTGENLAVLGEIDVSTIHHDGEWFSKMWAEYDKLRGFRSAYLRKLLIKPVDIKYIQFTVEEHQRADISFDPPQIPPPQEVAARNYEYAPCPLTTRPSPQTFLHYRQCKSCTGRRDKKKQMFRRLPKKLHRALLDVYLRAEPDEDVFGWGVLVVEGPNSTGITWLGALMLTFCAIVSIVYTVISKDASAGFTIGAFMTSVWVAWLTAFYFRWKDQ
jgi:hypothetical protein